jgi:hypothetical protein
MLGAARKPETHKTHTPHHARSPKEDQRGPRAVALLSQDPTVCQTLNRTHSPPTVPGTPKRGTVLGKEKEPAAAIC